MQPKTTAGAGKSREEVSNDQIMASSVLNCFSGSSNKKIQLINPVLLQQET